MAERPMPDPLEYELQESRAVALGHAGKKVEKALAALAAGDGDRDALLDAAATAVWELLITRESVRFYSHKTDLAYLEIPPAVMVRVGVFKRKS